MIGEIGIAGNDTKLVESGRAMIVGVRDAFAAAGVKEHDGYLVGRIAEFDNVLASMRKTATP